MTKDEALKMAHKTFMQLNERHPRRDNGDGCFDKELKAINEALEQPAQEPVAWTTDTQMKWLSDASNNTSIMWNKNNWSQMGIKDNENIIPLYTHPAPQPAQEHVLLNVKTHDDKTYKVEVSAPLWQGLSDDEKRKIWFKLEHEIGESILYGGKLSDAIEQALKEKNT